MSLPCAVAGADPDAGCGLAPLRPRFGDARSEGSVVVSLYQLHRCVRDYLRFSATGPGSNGTRTFDNQRYGLLPAEREAFENKDIAALYRIGLHPVLLNAFCRTAGLSRDEYRKVLSGFAKPEQRKGRWQ